MGGMRYRLRTVVAIHHRHGFVTYELTTALILLASLGVVGMFVGSLISGRQFSTATWLVGVSVLPAMGLASLCLQIAINIFRDRR
jgi:hypothetical protein